MQDDFTFERDQSRVQRLDHFHRDEQRRAQWPHTSRLFLHPYLNKSDCETGLYLGIVLGEQRAWPRAAEVLIETVACFEKADAKLNDEIANIRASTQPLDRQTRQIKRREAEIASNRRMIVTSWYNTAVSYFSLSKKEQAREFAEKVMTDDEFGERARQLLAQLR